MYKRPYDNLNKIQKRKVDGVTGRGGGVRRGEGGGRAKNTRDRGAREGCVPPCPSPPPLAPSPPPLQLNGIRLSLVRKVKSKNVGLAGRGRGGKRDEGIHG